MKQFKNIFYLFVLFTTCTALAGSYEDFFVAVKRNDGGSVTELLQRGFDPNTPDPSGNIALVLALQAENFAVAEALMARPGLNVNALNQSGESALMMAALRGNDIVLVPLADAVAQLKTVPPALYEEAKTFFG